MEDKIYFELEQAIAVLGVLDYDCKREMPLEDLARLLSTFKMDIYSIQQYLQRHKEELNNGK